MGSGLLRRRLVLACSAAPSFHPSLSAALEVALCEAWGNSRPEEGSEHYLAYCIEDDALRSAAQQKSDGGEAAGAEAPASMARRTAFVHGQLVGLCTVAVARWQELSGVCAGSEALAAAFPLPSEAGGNTGGGSSGGSGSFGAAQAAAFLRAVGLDCSFSGAGVTRGHLRAALLRCDTFVRGEAQLLPGVFHFASVPEGQVDAILDFVQAELGS